MQDSSFEMTLKFLINIVFLFTPTNHLFSDVLHGAGNRSIKIRILDKIDNFDDI